MTGLSIGDLSASFQLRRDNARLKGDLQRLTVELASGRTSDLRSRFQGDFRPLAALERDLASTDAFRLAAQEAGLLLTAAQSSLGAVQTQSENLLSSLLISPSLASPAQIGALGAQARQAFDSAVNALNVQVAGRTIFAGVETAAPALADAETILADISAAVTAAGAVNAAEVETVLDTWFAPGGAYDTVAYQGSTVSLQPLRVSPEDQVPFDATASDPALRSVLKGMALAALVDMAVLAGQDGERAALVARSGELVLSAKDELVDLRGRIGIAEQAVEAAGSRNAAVRSALEIARNDLVSADPFQVATELTGVETQLEALYTVTARLSGLSLTSFLR